MSRILIVDDDTTVGGVLVGYLQQAGHQARQVATVAQIEPTIAEMWPDLLVLDVMLPDGDGIDVCARIRRDHPTLPVILLTARTEEADRIAGLSAGADDYVTKPFSARELVLRVGSVLRRVTAEPPARADQPVLRDGDLVLDPVSHTATRAGEDLSLTGREFDLLAYLIAHPHEALSRDRLLADVWQWDFGDKSTVTVHVRRLREKVEPVPAEPRRLVTVWGIGYRWQPASGPTDGAPTPEEVDS